MQEQIAVWLERPEWQGSTPQSHIKKMAEEMVELALSGPDFDPDEAADVVIGAYAVAVRCGFDLDAAVARKHCINLGRRYRIDPETGLRQHVKEG